MPSPQPILIAGGPENQGAAPRPVSIPEFDEDSLKQAYRKHSLEGSLEYARGFASSLQPSTFYDSENSLEYARRLISSSQPSDFSAPEDNLEYARKDAPSLHPSASSASKNILKYTRWVASSSQPSTSNESVFPSPFLHEPDLGASSTNGPPSVYELMQKWLNLPHSEYYKLDPPSQCDPLPSGSPPLVATSEPKTTDHILEDLHLLATWLRLRDAALPDPIVGRLELDPTGVADRLGVRGLSAYTAFIDYESLQCRVCDHRSNSMALALLHQRHQRHFQPQ